MARKQGSHSEITGPKVHCAALRLFAQHGFAAVSMRQIASEVDVQAGALYNYTSDKQSLLFDLLDAHMQDLLTALDDTSITGSPIEKLEAFTRFHIFFHLKRTDLVFISYMELRNLTPDNFDIIASKRRMYENALEKILIEGRNVGDFEIQDTKISALAVIAMLTGVAHWYREDGRLDLGTIADLYWDMVRKSVGA